MQTVNRRETLRIDTKLWCRITSPALCAQSESHTDNTGRVVTAEMELLKNYRFALQRPATHRMA